MTVCRKGPPRDASARGMMPLGSRAGVVNVNAGRPSAAPGLSWKRLPCMNDAAAMLPGKSQAPTDEDRGVEHRKQVKRDRLIRFMAKEKVAKDAKDKRDMLELDPAFSDPSKWTPFFARVRAMALGLPNRDLLIWARAKGEDLGYPRWTQHHCSPEMLVYTAINSCAEKIQACWRRYALAKKNRKHQKNTFRRLADAVFPPDKYGFENKSSPAEDDVPQKRNDVPQKRKSKPLCLLAVAQTALEDLVLAESLMPKVDKVDEGLLESEESPDTVAERTTEPTAGVSAGELPLRSTTTRGPSLAHAGSRRWRELTVSREASWIQKRSQRSIDLHVDSHAEDIPEEDQPQQQSHWSEPAATSVSEELKLENSPTIRADTLLCEEPSDSEDKTKTVVFGGRSAIKSKSPDPADGDYSNKPREGNEQMAGRRMPQRRSRGFLPCSNSVTLNLNSSLTTTSDLNVSVRSALHVRPEQAQYLASTKGPASSKGGCNSSAKPVMGFKGLMSNDTAAASTLIAVPREIPVLQKVVTFSAEDAGLNRLSLHSKRSPPTRFATSMSEQPTPVLESKCSVGKPKRRHSVSSNIGRPVDGLPGLSQAPPANSKCSAGKPKRRHSVSSNIGRPAHALPGLSQALYYNDAPCIGQREQAKTMLRAGFPQRAAWKPNQPLMINDPFAMGHQMSAQSRPFPARRIPAVSKS